MRALLAVALALILVSCAGPQPKVVSVSTSDVDQQKTVVSVTLRNDAGEGSIRLIVTVKDKATGDVVGREETSVQLAEHERITVAVEVSVKEGVKAVDADAEARYPPD